MWDFIGLPGLQTGLRLGQLLGDVQDVVAHTFKVGEQLGVEDAGLLIAHAGAHTGQLAAAEVGGHVVDLLLQLGHVHEPVGLAGLGALQGGDGLQTDGLHGLQLLLGGGGEGDVLLAEQAAVSGQVVGVVADPLDVARDGEEAADHRGALLVGLDGDELRDVAGDLPVQKVDVLLPLGHLGQHGGVAVGHGLEALGHVLPGHGEHPAQLMPQLVDDDGGHTQTALLAVGVQGGEVFQLHAAVVLRLLGQVGQDTDGQPGQGVAEGQQDQGGADVEAGVDEGNAARRRLGQNGRQGGAQSAGEHHRAVDHLGDGENQEQQGEDGGADDIEQQVDDGGPLGVPAGAHRGQHGGDAGADVGAEQHKGAAGQGDDPRVGQGLHNAHRGGGGLDDGGEAGAHANAHHGVGEVGDQVDKGRGVPQGRHGGAHHVHADEQHTQTGQDLADVLGLLVLDEDHEHHAHKGEQRGQGTHVQGDEHTGDGGADVRAHDDPDGLVQRHHAGVDKAHHHDRGGRGGLDGGGDARAHQNAHKAVGRQPFQQGLHLRACRGLQTGAGHLHTVKEQGQAAQQ